MIDSADINPQTDLALAGTYVLYCPMPFPAIAQPSHFSLERVRFENCPLEVDLSQPTFASSWTAVATRAHSYRIPTPRAISRMGAEYPTLPQPESYALSQLGENTALFTSSRFVPLQSSASQRPMPLGPDVLPPSDPQSHSLVVEEARELPTRMRRQPIEPISTPASHQNRNPDRFLAPRGGKPTLFNRPREAGGRPSSPSHHSFGAAHL